MKPVLLAMNNPLSTAPEHALFPYPPGCTGYRIWMMLREIDDGILRNEYLNAFDRINLVTGERWSAKKAASAADAMIGAGGVLAGREVLALGDSVRKALGAPRLLIHPQAWRGIPVLRQLPHPSGRCRWYNDKTSRRLAAMLLHELYLRGKSCTS